MEDICQNCYYYEERTYDEETGMADCSLHLEDSDFFYYEVYWNQETCNKFKFKKYKC